MIFGRQQNWREWSTCLEDLFLLQMNIFDEFLSFFSFFSKIFQKKIKNSKKEKKREKHRICWIRENEEKLGDFYWKLSGNLCMMAVCWVKGKKKLWVMHVPFLHCFFSFHEFSFWCEFSIYVIYNNQ